MFKYNELMKLAYSELGIKPAEFWELTALELNALLINSADENITKSDLKNMIKKLGEEHER